MTIDDRRIPIGDRLQFQFRVTLPTKKRKETATLGACLNSNSFINHNNTTLSPSLSFLYISTFQSLTMAKGKVSMIGRLPFGHHGHGQILIVIRVDHKYKANFNKL